MKTYGLIGYPLIHSYSKEIFTRLFREKNIHDANYELFPLNSIEQLPELLEKNHGISGFNVTIPYKQTILKHLSKIDPVAEIIGAVNTVSVFRTSSEIFLKGYNTDSYGFEISLKEVLGQQIINALVLGNGGASKAIQFVLKKLKIPFIIATRKVKGDGQLRYNEINGSIISKHHLIINTTPLGMFPDISMCPEIPYEHLSSRHIVYDLVYNPEMTLFLKLASEKGSKVINGLRMLELQAIKSLEIWNNERIVD